MLNVKLISNFEELAQLSDSWNGLIDGVPFRRSQWLHTWWKHYGSNEANGSSSKRLFTLAVTDENNQLVGVAPLYRENELSAGQVLKLLGSGEVCSDYLSLMVLPDDRQEVVDAIAEFLISEVVDQWDLIQLDSIAANDQTIQSLLTVFQNRNCVVHQQKALNSWRLNFPEDWEAFLAVNSKSHRKQLRRLQKRILDTDRAELRLATNENEFYEGWQIFVDLHQRRWQSLGEPGCFSSEQFANFHKECALEMFKASVLRLFWLLVDGEPVAAEHQIAGSDCVFAYQSGLDPEKLDLGPGRLLTMATLQKAMEDGFQSIDFLRGDEPYKAHFRAEPRANVDLRIVAPKKFAKVRHQVWLASTKIKDFAKRQLSSR